MTTPKAQFIAWLHENGISQELVTVLDSEIVEAVGENKKALAVSHHD